MSLAFRPGLKVILGISISRVLPREKGTYTLIGWNLDITIGQKRDHAQDGEEETIKRNRERWAGMQELCVEQFQVTPDRRL